MSFGTTVLVVLVIIFLWHLFLRYSYEGRLMARIPGPRSWPLFGNTFTILKPPDELFILLRTMSLNYGNICKLEAFGIRTVHIFNPDDVEILISTTKLREKRDPYTFLKPWLRDGLIISNGSKWLHRRKLLTPAFHQNMLKKYIQIFNDYSENVLLKVKETKEEPIDLLPLISNTAVNILCLTLMGISLHGSKKAERYLEALQTFKLTLAERITRIWLHIELFFRMSQLAVKQKRFVRYLHELTYQIIQDKKVNLNIDDDVRKLDDIEVNNMNKSLTFLDLLIQKGKLGKVDLDGIREEIDTFIFAGHDTIATALCFFIVRIANEPEVQKRLSQEVWKIFGDSKRAPTIDDLTEMKYLDCCIKESLRIYPSAPLIARYTTKDVILSGYKVPAGTQCYIHIFDIHHRQDYFPEPEKFIPERFLPDKTRRRHPYSFIPFGAGPRNCIGYKFAMLEMKTIISGIIRRFTLQPVTVPENITYKADIMLRSSHPLYVRFRSKE